MQFNISDRMKELRGSAIREMFKAMSDPRMISLAGGNPAAELFPKDEMARIAKDILENNPVAALQYGISEGNVQLREKITEIIKERENINCNLDEITIVSGGQQAIEICAKLFLNEGDCVIAEEPSFVGALNAFRSYGAVIKGVKVDDDGMDTDALEKAIAENKNVKLIYTIPNFQNPSGITMSIEKRKRLLDIAVKNNIFVIEDNPYGELTFTGEKLPTIKSMDTEGAVLYCGSFSKILAPGLRLGFLIAAKNVTEKIVLGKQVSDVHTSLLPQLIALEYLKKYDLGEHIEKLRALYKKKCGVMIDAIEKYLPEEVKHTTPEGGLFVWCSMEGIDALKIKDECMKKKVLIVPGNSFAADQSKVSCGFRLNFSSTPDDIMVEGIKRLGEALKK